MQHVRRPKAQNIQNHKAFECAQKGQETEIDDPIEDRAQTYHQAANYGHPAHPSHAGQKSVNILSFPTFGGSYPSGPFPLHLKLKASY